MGRNGEDAQNGSILPDSQQTGESAAILDEDGQRARFYGLLARLLAAPMSDETLEMVRGLEGAGDDSELGAALSTLGSIAARTARGAADEEFGTLFYGMGSGGEVSPYGCQYLTGFVYEKPLSDLREDMAALGVQASGMSKEPEDHIAYLCEIMHGLISGRFGAPAPIDAQRKFFETHIAPWAGRFFSDLESAGHASLYMPVGTVGRLFMAIEAEAFKLAA